MDVVPLLGALVGCHCSVLCLGRVTTNFGGVDVVPLQGAIVVEGDDQLWGSGHGAIAGCHCSGGLWGSGRGAIAGCHYSVLWLGGHFSSTLITPKLVFAIWGLCWYNFYGKQPCL